MSRDPEDDALTLAALMQWQKERPDAAIVIAAADKGRPGEPLDIGLRLSNHTAAHLVGISMALINSAIEDIEGDAQPNQTILDRLRSAIAQLGGKPQPPRPKTGNGRAKPRRRRS
jgi:hypothetical protein